MKLFMTVAIRMLFPTVGTIRSHRQAVLPGSDSRWHIDITLKHVTSKTTAIKDGSTKGGGTKLRLE